MAQQSVAQALSLTRPRHGKSWDKSQLELPVFVIPPDKRPQKNPILSEALSGEMELQAKEANGTTSKGDSNMGGGRRAGDLVDGGSGDGGGDLVDGGSGDGGGDLVDGGSGDGGGDLVDGGSGDGGGDTSESDSDSEDSEGSDDDGDKETGEISENELGYTLGEEPLSSGFYWDHSYQAKVTNTIASTVSLDTRSALENHQMPYIQFLQHKKDIKRRNKEKKSKKILHKGLKIFMSRLAEIFSIPFYKNISSLQTRATVPQSQQTTGHGDSERASMRRREVYHQTNTEARDPPLSQRRDATGELPRDSSELERAPAK